MRLFIHADWLFIYGLYALVGVSCVCFVPKRLFVYGLKGLVRVGKRCLGQPKKGYKRSLLSFISPPPAPLVVFDIPLTGQESKD